MDKEGPGKESEVEESAGAKSWKCAQYGSYAEQRVISPED